MPSTIDRIDAGAQLFPASFSNRIALRSVQIGAIGVVVIATAFQTFELDRFLVPKELVLHVTALLAALCLLAALWRVATTRVDLLLAAYLALSGLSALMATNRWLALRALTLTASSIALFRIGRALRDAGLARPLLRALALAVVTAAITSLLQTYGLHLALFPENRAPGGTLGNRNFVAHVAAFGLPLVLLAALQSSRRYFIWTFGAALVVASLVLTRSRAAWLAFAAVILILFAAMLISAPLRRNAVVWRRLVGIVVIACGAVVLSLVVPNSRGNNPYLESVRHVAEYSEGSGHGRLVQYGESLWMALRHPLFGVGPGNWPVVYPSRVASGDPSLDQSNDGMTANPWPSSDWIAFISERGWAAFVLLALVFVALARNGFRRLRNAIDAPDALAAASLLAIVAGVVVAGTFDAVLLLAVPAFLVWTALGALDISADRFARPAAKAALVATVILCGCGVFRSGAELIAMDIFSTRGDRASLSRAAQIDPGNYRLQLRLARMGGRARCDHARAAHALFPSARAAADASRGCR
jgi:O-antigen ligase